MRQVEIDRIASASFSKKSDMEIFTLELMILSFLKTKPLAWLKEIEICKVLNRIGEGTYGRVYRVQIGTQNVS